MRVNLVLCVWIVLCIVLKFVNKCRLYLFRFGVGGCLFWRSLLKKLMYELDVLMWSCDISVW